MQRKSIDYGAGVQRYVLASSEPLQAHHLALIDDTERNFPDSMQYQVPPEQALMLRMLTRIVGPRRVLEIGTFTGLSAMLIAEGLDEGCELVCLDIDAEAGALARKHWIRAGLADRIELRLGPASETLKAMSGDRFDMVFLDADKPSYIAYLDAVLPMLRPQGLIVADNTLLRGTVLDDDEDDEKTEALRRFNRYVVEHPSLDVVLLPVFDGVSLIRAR